MLKLLAVLLVLSACNQQTQPAVNAPPAAKQSTTWVTDTPHNKVRIYDGTTLAHTVTLPPDSLPTGVAVGPDGNARIALTGDNLVVTMDATGNIGSSLDVPNPRGVTYDPNGNLWVAVTTPPQSYAAEFNGIGAIVHRVYTPVTKVPLGIWSLAVDSAGNVFMEVTDGGPGGFVYECSSGSSDCKRIAITPALGGIAFRKNLYVGFGNSLAQYAPPDWKSVASHDYGTGHTVFQLSVNQSGALYIPVNGLSVFVDSTSIANRTIDDTDAFGAAGN